MAVFFGRGRPRALPALYLSPYRSAEAPHLARLPDLCLHECWRTCIERTAGSLNHLQYPTDTVTLAVLWRFRYKFRLCDVAEMLLQRRFEVTDGTIRAWEFRFAPLVDEQLRARFRGRRL